MTTDTDRTWLLAIDTSTDWAGVALTNGSDLAELNWTAGRRQTVSVLAEIDRLCKTTEISIGQIRAVGVALGPGSFSGLRVGLSIAKGMALATDLKLFGISTMAVTIGSAMTSAETVIGVIRAGRSRYVWATSGAPKEFQSGTILEMCDAVRRINSSVLVCGEYTQMDAELLAIIPGCTISSGPERLRRVGVLAAKAWQRWQAADWDDPASIEPIYLHQSAPTSTN